MHSSDFTKTLEQQLRSKHEARSGEFRFIRDGGAPGSRLRLGPRAEPG